MTIDQSEFILWKPKLWNSRQRAGVEVYQSEKRELMAGDLIRWTRTDEALGLLSPELARVEKVGGDKVLVRSLKLTDQGLTPEDKVHRTACSSSPSATLGSCLCRNGL